MSDEAALLAAIRANPAEDMPRLMYADWLDENAAAPETVECPKCKDSPEKGWVHRHGRNGPGYYACPVCTDTDNDERRGIGTILRQCPLAGRAELIRVQVELTQRECSHLPIDDPCICTRTDWYKKYRSGQYCPACLRRSEPIRNLKTRQVALIAEHGEAWRKGPKCEKCDGTGKERHDPKIALRKRTCTVCHGTGDAGGLLREFAYNGGYALASDREPTRIEYERGLKRITVPTLADVCRQACGLCEGTGKHGEATPPSRGKTQRPRCRGTGEPGAQYQNATVPSPWLLAVVRHHPDVCEVVCLDREPLKNSRWDRVGWYTRPGGGLSHHLPEPIFDALRGGGEDAAHGSRWRWFSTAEAAQLSPARAIAQWAYAYAQTHPQEQPAA